MSSINKVFLMGNLTKAPELKFTTNGKAVANLSVAVNRSFKAENGEVKKTTNFFNIVAWGKLGETCAKFLPKGGGVHVEGRLQNRTYETSEHQKRTVTEVIADNIQFLTTPREDTGPQQPIPVHKVEEEENPNEVPF